MDSSSRYKIVTASRRRRLISKFFAFVLVSLGLGFSLGASLPSFIDWGRYKKEVEESLTKVFDARVSISGSIKGSLFMPKLEISKVKIDYDDSDGVSFLGDMQLRVSPLSLLFFHPEVSSVVVQNARLFIDKMFRVIGPKSDLAGTKVDVFVKDSTLGLSSGLDLFNDIKIKHAKVRSVRDELLISGDFMMGSSTYKLDLTVDDGGTDLKVHSDGVQMSVDFRGKQGKVRGGGTKLISVLADFFGLEIQQAHEEKFTIESDILVNGERYELKNARLDGENFKLSTQASWGGGEYDFSVVVSELNFDKLVAQSKPQKNLSAGKMLSVFNYLGNVIPKEEHGNFILSAKNVVYNSGVVEDFLMKAIMQYGEIKLDLLTATLPGNSTLNILGIVTNDEERSIFEGDLALIGNNARETLKWLSFVDEEKWNQEDPGILDLRAKISAMPKFLSLSDIVIKVGPATFSGDLKVQDGLGGGLISGVLIGRGADFDKYASPLKSKEKLDSFKALASTLSVEVDLYNSIFHGSQFANISFQVDSDSESLVVDKIRFTSEKTKFNGNIKWSYGGLRPSMILSLAGESFDLNLLDMPDFFELVSSDNYELGNKELKWASAPIHWFGMRDFDGKVDVKFDEVFLRSRQLRRFSFVSDFKDSVLSITKFEFDNANGGALTIVGNVGVEDEASLSISFAANGVDLRDVLRGIAINNVSGGMSCNGSLRSRGKNVSQLISNLSGSLNFSFRNVLLGGLNSDKLIDGLFAVNSKADLATLTQVVLFEGDTRFRTMEGAANISSGIMGISLQFLTDRASGVFSANFSLQRFTVNGLARNFFIPIENSSKVLFIDMNIQGGLWRPKVFFDNDALYNMILSKH